MRDFFGFVENVESANIKILEISVRGQVKMNRLLQFRSRKGRFIAKQFYSMLFPMHLVILVEKETALENNQHPQTCNDRLLGRYLKYQ